MPKRFKVVYAPPLGGYPKGYDPGSVTEFDDIMDAGIYWARYFSQDAWIEVDGKRSEIHNNFWGLREAFQALCPNDELWKTQYPKQYQQAQIEDIVKEIKEA